MFDGRRQKQTKPERETFYRVQRRHNGVLVKVRDFKIPQNPRRGDKLSGDGLVLTIKEVFARSGYEIDIIAA